MRRLYVHNFRCLENFELPVSGQSSLLLIGKNGSGKTTVGFALEVLQKIARGTNRVGELVRPEDLSRGRADVPMRFEIEVELEAQTYGDDANRQLANGFLLDRDLSTWRIQVLAQPYLRHAAMCRPGGSWAWDTSRSSLTSGTPSSTVAGASG